MEVVVGDHEVDQGVGVRVEAEVHRVAAAKIVVHAVRVVDHRGDAVESEPVEAVLLHPPAQIRQQEAQRLNPQNWKFRD